MYSIKGYGAMIADSLRTDAYCEALRRAVKPGAAVLACTQDPSAADPGNPARWEKEHAMIASQNVGFGRVLFHARQYWPDYISCVLVVRQDVIEHRPEAVQMLVDGIARSGLWLEDGTRRQAHRVHAADFVGRYYYRQNPALLRWALKRGMVNVFVVSPGLKVRVPLVAV